MASWLGVMQPKPSVTIDDEPTSEDTGAASQETGFFAHFPQAAAAAPKHKRRPTRHRSANLAKVFGCRAMAPSGSKKSGELPRMGFGRTNSVKSLRSLKSLRTLPVVDENMYTSEDQTEHDMRMSFEASAAPSEASGSIHCSVSSAPGSDPDKNWETASVLSQSSNCSKSTQGASPATLGVADPDRPLPFKPFCQKCSPHRPTDLLCLKPETLAGRRHLKNQDLAPQSFGKLVATVTTASKVIPSKWRGVRRAKLGKNPDGARKWINILESLQLNDKAPSNSMEGCGMDEDERQSFLCSDEDRPPVMHLLTPFEITRLECWAIQHVKQQYLQVVVESHAAAPAKTSRFKENMHTATICQLVRKAALGQLEDVELAFMVERLRRYPLLGELPEGMLEESVEFIEVRTFAKGQTMFKIDAAIDGIYILVQGDAEMTDGDTCMLEATSNVIASPAGILLQDAIQVNVPDRPFLLKPAHERLRSRTVRALDNEDASTMAMTLWLPFAVLVRVANFWRKKEAHSRIELIVQLFAPALRLDRQLCEKNCGMFELEVFHKNHAILQQGSEPSMDQARLYMIVEGEVLIVRNDRSPGFRKKSATPLAKDRVGPGKILGESALYAEPFPHYAMVGSKTAAFLTLRVSDFFEKLLLRPAIPLDKPLICSGTIVYTHETEAHELPEKAAQSVWKTSSIIHETTHELKRNIDVAAIRATEWKTVPEKNLLKWRQPPQMVRKPISHGADDTSGMTHLQRSIHADMGLTYPTDADLFPSVQRSVLAAQCKSSADSSLMSNASTTAPSCQSSRSMSAFASTFSAVSSDTDIFFAALDCKIRNKLLDAEELVAEHQVHKSLGLYMEDIDRPRTAPTVPLQPRRISSRPTTQSGSRPTTQSGSRPTTQTGSRPTTQSGSRPMAQIGMPPRNVVLLTCGAIPKCTDTPMSARCRLRPIDLGAVT